MRQLSRGVTLVELTVVIAVIALLAALLFPTFSAARERGRQGVCLSQLHQIGQALTMYRQDYGAYPPWRSYGQQLKPYIQDERLWVCPSYQASPGMQVAISYMNRLDGERLWETGKELGARSVIVYCDSHIHVTGYDRQNGGNPISSGAYAILRNDGAAELIPAGQVKSIEMPTRSPAPGVQTADVVLDFPE